MLIFIMLELGALYIIAPVFNLTVEGFAILLTVSAMLNAYIAFGMSVLFERA